jgi:acyl carrier protein
MQEKIKDLLLASGMFDLPETAQEELSDYGFDSLTVVLLISNLEKEFQIKFETDGFDIKNFSTIETIEKYILSLKKG